MIYLTGFLFIYSAWNSLGFLELSGFPSFNLVLAWKLLIHLLAFQCFGEIFNNNFLYIFIVLSGRVGIISPAWLYQEEISLPE